MDYLKELAIGLQQSDQKNEREAGSRLEQGVEYANLAKAAIDQNIKEGKWPAYDEGTTVILAAIIGSGMVT
jgi:hypothetical protein